MQVYYLNKHTMCEHYQCNSPVGFRVVTEKKGATARTVSSRSAMLFLVKGSLHVEGDKFPAFTVRRNQIFPMPAGIENTIQVLEDSKVLVLYFMDSKFRFCHNILSDEMIKSAPKRRDWLFPIDMTRAMRVFAYQTTEYIMDGLLCCDIQLIKQREFTAIMQAYYPTDVLATFLAPLFHVNLSFQETIVNMAKTYPSINEMADKVCMSRSTFIRNFTQCFGETPKAWINKVKAKALFKALRTTNDSMEEIARQFRFSSVQRLSTFCKETIGGTPIEIRNGEITPEQVK